VRPHLKTSFPRFSGSGVVHFRRSGELLTLEDPHGSVATLLDLLDGSRTPEQIADEMAGLAPGIAREAVLEANVASFRDHGGMAGLSGCRTMVWVRVRTGRSLSLRRG